MLFLLMGLLAAPTLSRSSSSTSDYKTRYEEVKSRYSALETEHLQQVGEIRRLQGEGAIGPANGGLDAASVKAENERLHGSIKTYKDVCFSSYLLLDRMRSRH